MNGFIGKWDKSLAIYYLEVVFAVAGIAFAAISCKMAVLCLLLAGLCKICEDFVIRTFRNSEDTNSRIFGTRFSPLCDVLAFVALPLAIVFSMCGLSIPVFVVAAIYSICGLVRISHHELTTRKHPEIFYGLPMVSAAFIIPLEYACLSLAGISWACGAVICVSMFFMAALFVVNFPIQRLKKHFRIALGVILVALAISVVVLPDVPNAAQHDAAQTQAITNNTSDSAQQ